MSSNRAPRSRSASRHPFASRPRNLPPRARDATQRAVRTCVEQLESRLLLTSTLYIDYGDSFAGGVLNTTVGDLDSHTNGGNPNIDGPVLSDSAGNNYANGTAVRITSLNSLYPTTGASLRATMDALVQRYYAPLDITVVDLTPTPQTVNGHSVQAATSLDDVSATLGANEGDSENNDSYVFVGQFLIGASNDNPAVFATNGYGGLSTGTDIASNNNNDGTALVLLIGTGDSALFNGNQIAHEAGHAFGLRHVYRQNVSSGPPALSNTTATGAQYDRLHQSELMSYLGYTTLGGFNFFDRYPMMQGDGNTDANVISTSPDPIQHFFNDPNIGPSPNIEYVTGTGENDIITITKTGATTANVSVQAFDDAAYTTTVDAPGSTGNTYSYSITLSKPLIIDAGGRADRIVLDGDLGNDITVRGMQGSDSLVVMGKNAPTANYTPGVNNTNGLDGNSDRRGTVTVGSTVIHVQEFESTSTVRVQDVGTLTVTTPLPTDTLTLDDVAGGMNQVTGTSGGIPMIPLNLINVANLRLDTGANDGGAGPDNVTMQSAAPATGLSTIAVLTGSGSDLLTVNFASGNPIPAGGLSYDGGAPADNDRLKLTGGSFTNETYTPTGAHSGGINLDGTSITYSNLAPIDSIVTSTNVIVNGTAAGDTINVVDGPGVDGVGTTQVNSPSFELLNLGNKTNLTVGGLGGADAITLDAAAAPSGLATVTLNGGANADSITLNRARVATTASGGTENDTITIVGAGAASGSSVTASGDAGDDAFFVTSSPDVPLAINGGANNPGDGDVLNVDGQTLDYTINPASFTTAGRQPVNFTAVETLGTTNGTFRVPGVIAPNVRANTGATVYGDGTVQGVVTGNTGGTLAPGAALGVSTAAFNAGGLTLNAGSTYSVDLNGLTPATQHDIVNVTGAVNLNGADLTGTAGYTAIPGDELVIIRNDGVDPVVGTFAQGSLVTIGGQKFAIDYAFDADGDGAFNDVALIRYGAALAPDPCDPTQLALYVSATTGADVIQFLPAPGNAGTRVLINGNDEGTFKFNGTLIAFGQSGDDLITSDMPARHVMFYGGVGNDTLQTGNQDGVLVGGFGKDTLFGGNGKDILIGGPGADRLEGGNGGDVLVAGSSSYDSTQAPSRTVLCLLLDDWSRAGKTLDTVLNNTTLFDDADVDNLLGQNGQDRFFLNTGPSGVLDTSDATKNEKVTDI